MKRVPFQFIRVNESYGFYIYILALGNQRRSVPMLWNAVPNAILHIAHNLFLNPLLQDVAMYSSIKEELNIPLRIK